MRKVISNKHESWGLNRLSAPYSCGWMFSSFSLNSQALSKLCMSNRSIAPCISPYSEHNGEKYFSYPINIIVMLSCNKATDISNLSRAKECVHIIKIMDLCLSLAANQYLTWLIEWSGDVVIATNWRFSIRKVPCSVQSCHLIFHSSSEILKESKDEIK